MKFENVTSKINSYFVTASWGPRAETPEALSLRVFSLIEALRPIDQAFHRWIYERKNDLEAHRHDFANYILSKIERDDFGEINPNSGYWFSVRSPDDFAPDRRFSLRFHAGDGMGDKFANVIVVTEDATVQPRAELHSFSIFRAVLLAIADTWNPETVEANCTWLVQRKKYAPDFRPAWMRYLCPALAQQARLPVSALVEHLANGGLLLLATSDTFDIDNPTHVAAAEEIAAALAPLRPA